MLNANGIFPTLQFDRDALFVFLVVGGFQVQKLCCFQDLSNRFSWYFCALMDRQMHLTGKVANPLTSFPTSSGLSWET
jgi:hypothetical protein